MLRIRPSSSLYVIRRIRCNSSKTTFSIRMLKNGSEWHPGAKIQVHPIPVVDFSAMSLDVKDPDRSNQAVKDIAQQVNRAFSTIGVVYITNHGISQETASLSCSNQWGRTRASRPPSLSLDPMRPEVT